MKIVFDKPNEFNPFVIRISTQEEKDIILEIIKNAYEYCSNCETSELFQSITGVSLEN